MLTGWQQKWLTVASMTTAMVPEIGNQVKRKGIRGPCRFPGITRDAEVLGVSRYFLYMVLSGKSSSRPLMERYRALKGISEANQAKG
jgi:hypothetical protein